MNLQFSRARLRPGATLTAIAVACCLLASPTAGPRARAQDAPVFEYVEIDSAVAGDCKMVGDIDGDGFADLVIGGNVAERLNWYRYPDWAKTVIATPTLEFTTDGALGDVDGDGDLDIVVPDGRGEGNLQWFENPRPAASPSEGSQWRQHVIGSVGDWGKDVRLADYDGDGRLDVATRGHAEAMVYFQAGANSWTRMTFVGFELGFEGMAAGDIDQDGDSDLVGHGVWWRNPGAGAARDAAAWRQFPVGPMPASFKALVVDLDQDGTMDLLSSTSEDTAPVDWWSPAQGDPTGPWRRQTLVASLEKAHTLQAADMDGDGDLDVVLGQMHTSQERAIKILYNEDGSGGSWRTQVLDSSGIHNGVVADIGGDGDMDIFGANWSTNPPVKLWLNRDRGGPPRPTVTPSPTAPPRPTADPASPRVTAGLVALYDFQEQGGSIVHDHAGVGEPLDLTITGVPGQAPPAEAASWLAGGGLAIAAPVVLISKGPATKIGAAAGATNELSLEAWLQPADIEQNGPTRVVTLSEDPFHRDFTLGQEFSALDVRLRTTATTDNGVPSLSTGNGAVTTALTHVVYTRAADGVARIYVDGAERTSAPVGGSFANWDHGFRLALANELTLDRPWLGVLQLVAIYDRALAPDEVARNFRAGPRSVVESRLYLPQLLNEPVSRSVRR